jgi:hypothetical protein
MSLEEDLPNRPFDDHAANEVPDAEDLVKAMDTTEPKNKPMDEIKVNLEYRAHQHLSDIGMRYQHLSDLLCQWEDAVTMMARRSFLGRDELFKKAGIELAIKQLKKTIEAMEDYGEHVNPIRTMIDQVPKAFAIFGGRGTPLKPWEPGQENID